MRGDKHAEDRLWAMEALRRLRAFVDDPDFEGNAEDEATELARLYQQLRDAKYRVVFLGAYNVGKSTLINAYLGDEYLPRVLEECTTKITHVLRSDAMSATLRLSMPAADDELQALRDLLAAAGVEAQVKTSTEHPDVLIAFNGGNPRELRNTLAALITVGADEDFPKLHPLRAKFDELEVRIPNERLEADIDLIDSPGVHSISETRNEISQGILPSSHLIVFMLDSQNAGNEHHRDFIEKLVRQHGRKMFFVINKADQLNDEEIDPQGHRGPARDLFRSVRSVEQEPELHFLSSLYALVAQQLAQGRLSLDDVGRDNKIRIPMGIQQRLLSESDPSAAVADYLMSQSRFVPFRARLLQYLYEQNEEGAVVQETCKIVADKAWRYGRPLETRLELARHVPKLDDLRREREALEARLAAQRELLDRVTYEFDAMSRGGEVNDTGYEGYEQLVESRTDHQSVESHVLQPLHAWMSDGENFRKARKQGYRPLTSELERRLDGFAEGIFEEVNRSVEAVEQHIRDAMGSIVLGPVLDADANLGIPRPNVMAVEAGMGKAYFWFTLVGAIVGGAAGAFIGAATHLDTVLGLSLPDVPRPDMLLGAAVGALVGGIAGLMAVVSGSTEARREKVNQSVREKVAQTVNEDIRQQLLQRLQKRREAFAGAVQQAFEAANGGLEAQIAVLRAEEDEIRRSQDEASNRLAPKINVLMGMSRKAREIVDAKPVGAVL